MDQARKLEIYNRYKNRSLALQSWCQSKKHLPEIFRWSDRQTDQIFRLIHWIYPYDNRVADYFKISNIQAECYTVDKFLWFMGKCGWTLQRSRAAKEWVDLAEMLKLQEAYEGEEFRAVMEYMSKPSEGKKESV